MPVFNPISNVRTSQVFNEMIKGNINPKAIADALHIQSPPVIQQLKRLKKIGLVRLGEKNGKLQNYKIDKEKFAQVFLKIGLRSVGMEIRLERKLTGNKYFPDMILNYIPYYFIRVPNGTLSDAIREFEDGLIRIIENNRRFKIEEHSNDREIYNLLTALNEWEQSARTLLNLPQEALLDYLKKMDWVADLPKK